nr:hypothetical protein CFP56_48018 [Quercus suber]
MIGAIDETTVAPDQFLKDSSGNFTTEINPAFLTWKSREQALFTFLNSTLSPSVLALTVGQKSEYDSFSSAIRTRSDVISIEELNILLNAEERAIKKRSGLIDTNSMAMAANYQSQGFHRGRGRYNNHRGRGGGGRGNFSGGSSNGPFNHTPPQFNQPQSGQARPPGFQQSFQEDEVISGDEDKEPSDALRLAKGKMKTVS